MIHKKPRKAGKATLKNRVKIAWAIKQVREKVLKMTQKQMAEKLGINQQCLTRWEGAANNIYTSTLFKFEKAFGDGVILKIYNYYVKAEEDYEWLEQLYKHKKRKNRKQALKRKITEKINKLIQEEEKK